MLQAGLDGARDGEGRRVENAQEVLGHDLRIYAVNVRVLRGVEWDKLGIKRADGRAKEPLFVAD